MTQVVVQRPAVATDVGGNDLLAPTRTFLNKLGLMPKLEEPERTETTEEATIDNALQISKSATGFAQLATGAGGGVSVIAGIVAAAQGMSDLVIASLALATAIIIAAGTLAVARVADGDVRSRAALAGNKVAAKAEVTRALLDSYDQLVSPLPSSSTRDSKASEPGGDRNDSDTLLAILAVGLDAKVKSPYGQDTIKGFRWLKDRGWEARLESGDYVSCSELSMLDTP